MVVFVPTVRFVGAVGAVVSLHAFVAAFIEALPDLLPAPS